MKNKLENEHDTIERKMLMLTEEDIDAQLCYKHLTSAQKEELIKLIYDLSIVLYKNYFDKDEST